MTPDQIARAQRDALDRAINPPVVLAFLGYDEAGKLKLKNIPFEGLASRYWPADTEDHQHMNDLTLSPAPKGGFTVLDYDDDILFAGELDACTGFMASHFKELEAQRLAKASEEARQRSVAAQVEAVRRDAEDRVASIRAKPQDPDLAPGTLRFTK